MHKKHTESQRGGAKVKLLLGLAIAVILAGVGVIALGAYIDKVVSEGYEATTYLVDYHAKFAFPVVCLIMSLLGVAIAARSGVKEGLAMSVVYGIGVAFLYWVFHSFCLSLGYGGVLPVWVAAWTTNLVFLCVSGFLLLHAD